MKIYMENELKLRSSDYDTYDELTPYAILDIFQDIAGEHATKLGLGFHDMISKNLLWVLLRTKYEVVKMPQMYENVIVSTWPEVKGRADMNRDYLIKNDKGEVLIKGKSKWVVIDLNSRRLVRASNVNYPDGEYILENTFDELYKLDDFDIENLTPHLVRTSFSDLDHNGHVNNASYANYIVDVLNLKREEKIKTFEINYEKELMQNQCFEVYVKRDDKVILLKGLKEDTLIFKAKLELV